MVTGNNLHGNGQKKITVTGNRENYHGMNHGRVCGSFFYQGKIPVATPMCYSKAAYIRTDGILKWDKNVLVSWKVAIKVLNYLT